MWPWARVRQQVGHKPGVSGLSPAPLRPLPQCPRSAGSALDPSPPFSTAYLPPRSQLNDLTKPTAEVSRHWQPPDHNSEVKQMDSKQFCSFLQGKRLGAQPRERPPAWSSEGLRSDPSDLVRAGWALVPSICSHPELDSSPGLRAATTTLGGHLHPCTCSAVLTHPSQSRDATSTLTKVQT